MCEIRSRESAPGGQHPGHGTGQQEPRPQGLLSPTDVEPRHQPRPGVCMLVHRTPWGWNWGPVTRSRPACPHARPAAVLGDIPVSFTGTGAIPGALSWASDPYPDCLGPALTVSPERGRSCFCLVSLLRLRSSQHRPRAVPEVVLVNLGCTLQPPGGP